MLAAAGIIEMFAPYSAAREKLKEAITVETEIGHILLGLTTIADQLNLDPVVSMQFKVAARPLNDERFIWQSRPTKATSVKLGNLTFEFGQLAELIIGLVTTISKDVMGEANLILKAAGVLLLISNIYKATVVKLDEREATVFYGFTKVGPEAEEEAILTQTNQVRRAASLKPLNRRELRNALYKLAEIKSVVRVEDSKKRWRIIEHHNVDR
jgi:hypothetical protein